MSDAYDMEHNNGQIFIMGANINDCQPGDAVKVGSRVEIIKSISSSPLRKWDRNIRTEEGGSYGMMDVNAYGRKKNES